MVFRVGLGLVGVVRGQQADFLGGLVRERRTMNSRTETVFNLKFQGLSNYHSFDSFHNILAEVAIAEFSKRVLSLSDRFWRLSSDRAGLPTMNRPTGPCGMPPSPDGCYFVKDYFGGWMMYRYQIGQTRYPNNICPSNSQPAISLVHPRRAQQPSALRR